MQPTAARLLFPLALAAASAAGLARAEPDNSLNVGIGGIPRLMKHCAATVYSAEYERAYSAANTVLLRGGGVPYRFDNGTYQEDGRMKGADLGARHYYGGRMQGLFAGASLGYWTSEWSFMHPSNRGTASSYAVRLNLEFGDRIVLGGSRVSLLPEVSIGKFFWSSSCSYTYPAALAATGCSQKSEVDGYGFLGLLAGVAF